MQHAPRVHRSPTHLITFMVEAHPVPWKVSRRGTKPPHLVEWQKRVNDEARVAWGFNTPAHEGPVGLSMWFYLTDPGENESHLPDLTNLEKGVEDALQGVVIRNDRKVVGKHGERLFLPRGRPERAYVQVWAFPNGGHVEPVEPGPYSYTPWAWWLRPMSA